MRRTGEKGRAADAREAEVWGDFRRHAAMIVRCHPGLRAAINAYATERGLSQNEAARLLLVERLREVGSL